MATEGTSQTATPSRERPKSLRRELFVGTFSALAGAIIGHGVHRHEEADTQQNTLQETDRIAAEGFLADYRAKVLAILSSAYDFVNPITGTIEEANTLTRAALKRYRTAWAAWTESYPMFSTKVSLLFNAEIAKAFEEITHGLYELDAHMVFVEGRNARLFAKIKVGKAVDLADANTEWSDIRSEVVEWHQRLAKTNRRFDDLVLRDLRRRRAEPSRTVRWTFGF